MTILSLPQDFSMVPLHWSYCDYWSDKLGIHGFVSDEPLLNGKAVHHMLEQARPNGRFAIIGTDYHGGTGNQSAAVYEGTKALMEPRTSKKGPINEALRLLGVKAGGFRDEF